MIQKQMHHCNFRFSPFKNTTIQCWVPLSFPASNSRSQHQDVKTNHNISYQQRHVKLPCKASQFHPGPFTFTFFLSNIVLGSQPNYQFQIPTSSYDVHPNYFSSISFLHSILTSHWFFSEFDVSSRPSAFVSQLSQSYFKNFPNLYQICPKLFSKQSQSPKVLLSILISPQVFSEFDVYSRPSAGTHNF